MPRTTAILLAMAATFVIDGIAAPFIAQQHSQAAALIHGVLVSILCYVWVRADALQRASLPPGSSAVLAAVFPVIGIPAYLLRTRGLQQGLLGSGVALAFVASLAATDGLLTDAVLALVAAT